ncbi:MAG: alpha amylase catalytic domain-containing protein [Anaerolineaceae bacterium]|nr:MAG: alpha amylase catalytic domain-containing protein [Anaerolineaceae bacterium]
MTQIGNRKVNMNKRPALLTLVLLVVFTACAKPAAVPVQPVTGTPPGTDGYPWWNDTVFYEIFVRSFYDSDGDGIGDFNGITAKLDYLNDGDPETTADLGVTGIWLMPINPSPSYHGYDVTDYYAVNPDYGTLDDFQNMLDEAHKRGIRVIIDMVLNHTSSQHPWFTGSWDPASPYHDWYVWSDTRPAYTGPWGQNVWHPSHGQYYYALFWNQMPDLNYANPAVTAEMNNVIRFWLTDVGVDGFRLDAVKHLVEEGANMQNTGSTHTWLQQFRTVYKGANPDALAVGEVWDDLNVIEGYVEGDELDLVFQFSLAEAFVYSANAGNASAALDELKLTCKLLPPLQYAPFLTNHDMNRVMSQLDGDAGKARVAASMLLTAPGVPFIYYGEEIGLMGEKPDEDIRRPMQWSSEKYAGFSTAFPWRSVGPGWETNNAAAGTGDPASLLSHYQALIRIRSQHAALRVGDTYTLRANDSALYPILRVSGGEIVLVIVNLSDAPVSGYSLSLKESGVTPGTYRAFPILGAADELPELTFAGDGSFTGYVPLPEIPAYATLIVQLQIKK